MPEYPVSATRIPSCGSARVISAQSRSGYSGAAFDASSGARSRRQAATMPAARSAKALSRVGLPSATSSLASVAFGSPIAPVVFG